MVFVPQTAPEAGALSTVAEFQQLIDNINDLNMRTQTIATDTYPENSILIGDDAGTITSVTLTDGGILLGSANAPVNLARGTNNQTLIVTNGVVAWGTPPSTIDAVDIALAC